MRVQSVQSSLVQSSAKEIEERREEEEGKKSHRCTARYRRKENMKKKGSSLSLFSRELQGAERKNRMPQY